jgi:probable rRNA maturation factor
MRLLRRVIENLLEELSIDKNSDLGVYVVSTPEMAHLNETFLRHEGSTDVLAFDYAEATAPAIRSAGREPKAHPKAEDRNCPPALRHGEVFVCLDEAGLQAGRFRTTWQNELVRYVVHGFLHLCGYDDHTRLERGKMKRVENRLLRQIAARFRLDQLGS